jgi:glycosyltransferase involved in cell wall biosynthesis
LLFLASRDLTHPQAAGGDMVMYNVASGLARDGHEVRYICSRFPGMVREDRRDNLQVIRVGNLFTTSAKFLISTWRFSRRWADAIVEEVVGGLRVPYVSAWFSDLPRLCLWYQSNRALFTEQYGPLVGRVLSRLEREIAPLYANAIILTLSQASKRDLIKLGLPSERILVCRPGIDETLMRLAEPNGVSREQLLVSIGKMRRYKCFHHAIRVLSRLRQLGIAEAKLTIAGRSEDETYRRYLLDLARDLGVSDSVRIETDITEERKANLLHRAKLMLITSPLEGFGLTAVEGNLFGVPAIGTTGVPPDVVHEGRTGYRVGFGDINAFATVSARLLNDANEWTSLSNHARDYGKGFTWDATLETVRTGLDCLGVGRR